MGDEVNGEITMAKINFTDYLKDKVSKTNTLQQHLIK